ncbi:type II toxin-antitoxin system HipA family toxin [Acidithiobacillus caldus]|nr:type II toxin-antitoxin system HipA family toxin [Acidithiobacillus caldus]OFC41078.1 protein HipA [Acidithiobacillus caldus]
MNGLRVGDWLVDGHGTHIWTYDPAWLASPYRRPISLSLPLSGAPSRGQRVRRYFDNLLPDSPEIRRRIQRRFNAPSMTPMDLLAEIGRDCVGAVQLLPDDQSPQDPDGIAAEPLSEAQVAAVLAQITTAAYADADDFRISLAGAQEKTALLFLRGQWYKPKGPTATTHILKLPIGQKHAHAVDLRESVENEWLCIQILQAYGLPTAKATIETFIDQKVLVVERFDRRLTTDGRLLRLPQEDLCQALGVGPEQKYETEGGPGIPSVMDVLLGSDDPAEDRRRFFLAQVVFLLLAAIDGHGKNFSIFLEVDGRYRLTPLYDVLSAHPILGNGPGQIAPQKLKMAMAWQGERNRTYHWQQISRRHILETAKKCGIPYGEVLLDELLSNTPHVIDTVGAKLYPGFPQLLAESILQGMKQKARQLTTS